jgi:hypothetical protein
VRKVWSKEFQGLDTPSAQIKRLKDMLTGLGMEGRMSHEQAKTIRAKRELAQELGVFHVHSLTWFLNLYLNRGCGLV